MKRILVQSAQAAARKKGSYLRARYKRLAGRRGKKKAVVAVAHKILIAAYYIIKDQVTYKDLGEFYFDQLNRQSNIRYHLSRLNQLGVIFPNPIFRSNAILA